jgi:outer membrane protein assembly factor BamA
MLINLVKIRYRTTLPALPTLLLASILMYTFTPMQPAQADIAATASTNSDGLFGHSRRRNQYGKDFAYFAFPFATDIPGYGSAYGGIGMASNIGGSDTDVLGFYMDGDFSTAGLTLLDVNLIPKRLVFDIGLFNYQLAFNQYARGIDSSPDNYIRPEYKGNGVTTQLTLTFLDRMLDVYGRYAYQDYRTLRVLDAAGNTFPSINTSSTTWRSLTLGLILDLTDDRLDPRRGLRFEFSRQSLLNNVDPIYSTFSVYDSNLTYYLPVGRRNTWVFNVFKSDAVRESLGSTDRTELTQRFGLDCSGISDPAALANCTATNNQRIDEIQAANLYGSATPLGGTQRLRSFANQRFHAGHALAAGTEFRWNLTEENTLIDWIILRGIRTNIQTAFFAEAGSVADHRSELSDKLEYSYGMGLRVVFSGAVLRLDFAHGNEGLETQLFLNYAWSMFSLDSPK